VYARGEIFRHYDPHVYADDGGADFQYPVTLHLLWRDDESISTPDAPVTDAVDDAVTRLAADGHEYDIIGICQATAPTLPRERIATELMRFIVDTDNDSAATMRPFHGFIWAEDSGPQILDRVNRQYSSRRYIETGGLQLVRGWPRLDGWYGADAPQIGAAHDPSEIPADEAIDIDTAADLAAAETILRRFRCVIVTQGDQRIGSGHLHRAAAIAAQLDPYANVDVVTLDTAADMAAIVPSRWRSDRTELGHARRLVEEADVAVFDVLDNPTVTDLISEHGDKIIRMECDNPVCGAAHHVNALRRQPAHPPHRNHHCGSDWLDLRWDFLGLPPLPPDRDAPVLVTFGGTDPAGWTVPVASALHNEGHPVIVVTPPAAASTLDRSQIPDGVQIVDAPHMPGLILGCSTIVTSQGRTAWEAAYLHRPVVTLPANEREAEHNLTPPGALNQSGLHGVLEAVGDLLDETSPLDPYMELCVSMRGDIDGLGLDRIVALISQLADRQRARQHTYGWPTDKDFTA
jgi:spore coat polysaccharide biosynthesis predicted glycosyltransferase SpsG